MTTELRELGVEDVELLQSFFADIFTREPWNDDWSDTAQLHAYILDLIGNPTSLTLGFYREGELAGLAMGSIRHWYEGTQYSIDELCIQTKLQGMGLGTQFLKAMEKYLASRGIHTLFLQTERTVPAYEFYMKNGFRDLTGHVSLVKNF